MIFPSKKKLDKDTGEVRYTYDMDIISRLNKSLAKEKKKPSKITEKSIKKYLYKNETDQKLYMLQDVELNFQTADCVSFISLLFKTLKGGRTYEETPEDANFLLQLKKSLGLNYPNLKNKKFINYLYNDVVESKNSSGKSHIKVLKGFVSSHPDRKKIENSMLYFGVKANTAEEVDFNFMEKIQDYRSNQEKRIM